MVSLIAPMHHIIIKAVGCVVDMIELLCRKTPTAVNNVKVESFGQTSNDYLVFQFNRAIVD